MREWKTERQGCVPAPVAFLPIEHILWGSWMSMCSAPLASLVGQGGAFPLPGREFVAQEATEISQCEQS